MKLSDTKEIIQLQLSAYLPDDLSKKAFKLIRKPSELEAYILGESTGNHSPNEIRELVQDISTLLP